MVDYYRATPTRPLARAIATGHPVMRIIEANSTGRASEPINVVANQIVAEGDSLVFASGTVEITRPDVIAKGDSAFLDNKREFARLLKSPSVQSRRDRPFTLRGGVIDLYSKNRVLQRVVATPDGHVLSQDLELVADTVDLRMSNDRLDRVMAWGGKQARAISPEREIIADSIDAIMPGQRLREVRAVRNAYANSLPDTAHVISTERDWIRGDVIVAEFDSVAISDTASKPVPRRIVSTGHAVSYYQLAADTRTKSIPNINYVKGKAITIQFENREVRTVDVFEEGSWGVCRARARGNHTIRSPGHSWFASNRKPSQPHSVGGACRASSEGPAVSLQNLSPRIREIIRQLSGDERSIDIALGAIISAADESGSARFQDVAARYRDEYLRALRAEGRDAEREAGRLGLDEVRKYFGDSIIPRLIGDGALVGPAPRP